MKLLDRIKGRFRFSLLTKKKPAGSLVEALTRVSGQRVVKHVLTASPDRRHWLTLAAAWLGISERELQNRLANALGLEVAGSNNKLPESKFLGAQIHTLLPELHRIGAVPFETRSKEIGLLCIDPVEAKSLVFDFQITEFRLSTWPQISALLDQLEEESQKLNIEKQSVEREQSGQIAKQVLGFLLAEVESYQKQELDLLTGQEGLVYQFLTQDNKRATGKVFPRVAPALVHLLSQYKPGAVNNIFIRSKGVFRKLSVTKLASEGNYRLNWEVNDDEQKHGIVESSKELPQIPEFKKEEVKTVEAALPSSLPALEPKTDTSTAPPLQTLFGQYTQKSTRPLVVVIDDNVMFVKVLERFLDRAGMDTIHAKNGEEGLKLLLEIAEIRHPVVVCDLHMPIMNGREVITKLRADETLRKLRVIILTSDDDVEAEINLLAQGADSFIAKSKDPRVLTSQVKRFVEATSTSKVAA